VVDAHAISGLVFFPSAPSGFEYDDEDEDEAMLNHPPRERPWVSWLLVAAWSLVIFATIPVARQIQRFVDAHWGRQAFTDMVLAAIVLGVGGEALYLCRRRLARWSQYAWLIAAGALFTWRTYALRGNPEESLHFIEYGVLGALLFRALGHDIRNPAVYLAAALAGSLVGTADEIIQWLTPDRIFDYRDIWLNAYASLLAQAAIAGGLRPSFIAMHVGRRSVRWVCALAAAELLLLGLCLSNTPATVGWYTSRIPALAYLQSKDNVMSEYGYRHVDPAMGTFFSRLTLEELVREDARRAEEVARILEEYRGMGAYERFLATYAPQRDPFVHEARVHLFRRDHYLAVAWKHRTNPASYFYHMTVAYRENQIMEKYFGRTLRASAFRLKPEYYTWLERGVNPDLRYVSAVSSSLITRFSERQAWVFIVLAGVVLALVSRYCGREKA
ncbi:MAG: VanZ family protein, partial [Verrucomicrobiota bacterium]